MLNFRGPLIEDLVAKGHSVTAMAPDMDEPTRVALRALGAEVMDINLARTGMNPLADFGSIIAMRNALLQLRPDITLGYAAKPVIYGTIAAWLAGVPTRFAMVEGLGFVFISRDKDSLLRKMLRKTVKSLYRFALSKAKTVFFLNNDDIADFTQMGMVQQDKAVRLGGIGVDLDLWKSVPWVSEPVTFTLVARLLRDKGVLEFVEAARIVKSNYANVRVLLVGGLDSNPEAIQQSDVDAWVAEGIVEWAGHVPVQPWIAQTSVFVLPSYREGVPRSTQEAMAAGRAVITTDVPGCRDTVIEGRNGFLIPPRNGLALANAMIHFIDDQTLIVAMGRESRRLAEERFDVREVNSRLIKAMGL